MTEFKPWRFYRSPRGLYVIVVNESSGDNIYIRRLSTSGVTTDIWKLSDFLENYSTADMMEVPNPFEGVQRIPNWLEVGLNNREVDQ